MQNWICPECNRRIEVRRIHFPIYCTCGLIHHADGRKQLIADLFPPTQPRTNSEVQDKLRRSRLEFAGLKARREQGNKAWRAIHCYDPSGPHDQNRDLAWLESTWEPMIPQFGCNCMDFYREYKKSHPPTFADPASRFQWGVSLHNSVNNKLSVPPWSHDKALAFWRPHQYWGQQPRIEGVTAVTSLSPLDAHQETQDECIRSWMRFGLRVVSGNLPSEIPSLANRFPGVEFRPVEASKLFDRPTPRIIDLMRLVKNTAVLLINSDVSIYGPQKWLLDALDTRTATVGVRHNWTGHPGDADEELWGLDAFLLFSEQIASYPDLDLAIGQPVWDYWVAYHLQEQNVKVQCLGDRVFFHRRHVLNWNTDMTDRGLAEVESVYGKGDWNKWRRAFGEGRRELHRATKLCSIGPITVKNTR
jgi:hypothetical protein